MKGPIFAVATIAFLVAILKPKIEELGIFRTVPNFNNDRCKTIPGLESCEDIFLDHPSGLAYLACSTLKQRALWVPALDILKVDKIKDVKSSDYIAILDLKTQQYRKIKLNNLSSSLDKEGFYLHGLDLFVEPEEQGMGGSSIRKASLYLINHRPPAQDNPDVADSVVEVFDTFVGSSEATYRTTFKHPLIITPNNIVAISHNSFYVTNDHATKKHWTRKLELFYPSQLDSVVYCNSSELGTEDVRCISALHGRYSFPNGIAKGPKNLLYLSNSMDAYLRILEIQADKQLKVTQEIKVPRHLDNIYVTESGSIFLASVPRMLQFLTLFHQDLTTSTPLFSPSEVWKISNQTHDSSPSDQSLDTLKLEKVFGDDGNLVSGTTAVGVWNSKLFLTGIGSAYVSVCEIRKELAD